MLGRLDPGLGRGVALTQRRHPRAVLVVGFLVAAFFVEREEAGEEHHLAGRAQHRAAGAVGQFDGRALEPRRRHLAGQRAVEDQAVEPRMIAARGIGLAEIGRADRFMRFLRILDLGGVMARLVGDVAGVIAVGDRAAGGADRFGGHLHAVGAHVGDQPVLVERLGDAHRVAGREAELARRFLLQRRGGERRRRVAPERLGLDRRDGEAPGLDHRLGGVGVALVADRQAVDLLAVELRPAAP